MKITCQVTSQNTEPHLITKVCNNKNCYIADFCKDSYFQFLSWNTYLITSYPGSGKSYMCVNKIIPKAYTEQKKVLLLVNRSKLSDQYKKDIMQRVINGSLDYNPCTHSLSNDFDRCLTIMTYQKLEELLANYREDTLRDLDKNDILIADEVHYFLNDSTYNPSNILSAEIVLLFMASKTRYLLSATLDNIKPIILNPIKYFKPIFTPLERFYTLTPYNQQISSPRVRFTEYIMVKNYNYIDVFYFNKTENIIEQIINSKYDEKWLYFVSNKKKAESLANEINTRYKEVHPEYKKDKIASFISADYRNKEQVYMKSIMDDLTITEDIKTKVLITTPVLDNGINIKSHDLKNIVIHSDNIVSFIQMLGRKRLLNKNERINLYIPSEDINLFEKRKQKIENIISDINQCNSSELDCYMTKILYSKDDSRAESFRSVAFPITEYIRGYPRSTFYINELSQYQLHLMYNNYTKILDRFYTEGNIAFLLEQLSWLGIDYDNSKWLPDKTVDRNKTTIEKILLNYTEEQLTAADLEKLLEEIKAPMRNVVSGIRSNRISVKQVNQGLEALNSEFRIDKRIPKVYRKESTSINNNNFTNTYQEDLKNEN